MRPPQQHCTFLQNNCPLLIKGWKMRSILVLLKWSFVAIQEAAIILIVWSLSIVTSKKSIMNESNHIWYHLLDDLFPLCITSNDEFGLLSIKKGLAEIIQNIWKEIELHVCKLSWILNFVSIFMTAIVTKDKPLLPKFITVLWVYLRNYELHCFKTGISHNCISHI